MEKIGEKSSRVQEVEDQIDRYIEQLSLNIQTSPDINKYVGISEEELRGFSYEDCEIAALLLSEQSLNIQIKYNKLHAMSNWIEANIDWIISGKVHEYSGYSYEERKKAAIKDDGVAFKLAKLKTEVNTQKECMFNLSNKVENMSKFYMELAKGKKWNR